MVVYIFTDGNVKIVSPENIYQGSTVSEITLLTPFPSTTSLSVGFVMPDGTRLTAQPMNYTQTIVDGQSVTAYTYTLPYTVTEQAGEVQMAFAALFSNGTQTSYMARFEVQESVLPTPPAQPDEDTYELILKYAQTAMQNAANAQSAAEAAQEAAESAETKASQAVDTADEANETANAANATAGQANTKADQAVTTSNNAAATAAAANQTAIEAKGQASAAQNAAAQAQEDADAAAKSAQAAENSASEAADSAEEAVTAAHGAVTTANEAKTIADGIDSKATEALENSEQAITTANEAKALAEQAVAGAGTEVYVNNALQARLDFTSDPQTQIDNIKSGTTKVGAAGQADKLAQARNLKVDLASGEAQSFDGYANAEDIGVEGVLPIANGGTGASDLDSVKVGEAGSADEATKLAAARNFQVNIASGNPQTFDGSADATEIGVKGILPVGNGGTGATSLENITVGRAKADANGNVIDTTYSKLTQAVRTDTVSSNTDEQKRVANENTLRFITGSPVSAGWYRVATLSDQGIYEINVSSTYSINAPVAIKFIVAVSTSSGYNTSITQIGGAPNLSVVTQARLNQESGSLYFEIYVANPNNPIGVSYKAVTSWGNGLSNITPVAFTNIAGSANVITAIKVVCGIATTGGVYQNGSPVLVGSALTWVTGTSGGLTLPSGGWYIFKAGSGTTGIIYWDETMIPYRYVITNEYGTEYILVSAGGTITARGGSTPSSVGYYKLA